MKLYPHRTGRKRDYGKRDAGAAATIKWYCIRHCFTRNSRGGERGGKIIIEVTMENVTKPTARVKA